MGWMKTCFSDWIFSQVFIPTWLKKKKKGLLWFKKNQRRHSKGLTQWNWSKVLETPETKTRNQKICPTDFWLTLIFVFVFLYFLHFSVRPSSLQLPSVCVFWPFDILAFTVLTGIQNDQLSFECDLVPSQIFAPSDFSTVKRQNKSRIHRWETERRRKQTSFFKCFLLMSETTATRTKVKGCFDFSASSRKRTFQWTHRLRWSRRQRCIYPRLFFTPRVCSAASSFTWSCDLLFLPHEKLLLVSGNTNSSAMTYFRSRCCRRFSPMSSSQGLCHSVGQGHWKDPLNELAHTC